MMSLSLLILASACTKEYSHEVSFLNGEELKKLVEESDKPYVLLNFYNTGCKPCVKEIPDLAQLLDHPHKHLDVHFVALDEENDAKKELKYFWQQLAIETPIYCINNESLNQFLLEHRLSSTTSTPPMSLILSRDGRLIERISTVTDAKEVSLIIHKDESFGN